MRTTHSRFGAIAVAGTAVLGAAATSASGQITLTDPVLRFEASNSSGSGFIDIAFDPGASNPDGSYFWTLAGPPLQITDGPNTIATVTAASLSAFDSPFKSLGVGFTVFAGDSETTFTVTSTLSSYAAQAPGEARTSGGVTLTDSAGSPSGATLVGNGNGGAIWSAFINGGSPGTGDVFSELIVGPFAVGNNASNAWSDESAPAPIFTPTAPVSSMTTIWEFTLSEGDQVGTSSNFFVVPAPGSLLVLGGMMAFRRRR